MHSRRPDILPICGAALLAVSMVSAAMAADTAPAGANASQTESKAADSLAPAPETSSTPDLAESLAAANREAAALREENAQLRLQAETLGLAGLTQELRPLQERLIAAVADYRLSDLQVKNLTERLVSLSEASLALVSDPADPTSRIRLQQELAAANQTITAGKTASSEPPVPVENAKVISLKDDLGLAVINTGAESGLRLGTPIRVVRAETTIATGLVVDVRNRIAGVLLTSSGNSGAPQVGDQVKPETISNLK